MIAKSGRESWMTGTGRTRDSGTFAVSSSGREYFFEYYYYFAFANAAGRVLHARRTAPEWG